MEKKYQVFVSSTYEDLKDERKEVIQALLEVDCIPVGMELFPAADDDQWSFIKNVIDECDYYVLILAGRYGSCAEDGMGYTEMEYRYALEKGKPIIAFLHENPETLPANKTEQEPDKRDRLKGFRGLVQKKVCRKWSTAKELGGLVSRSIMNLKKRSPATGWVRADSISDEDATREILRLRKEVEELREKLERATHSPPEGTESLAQGEDSIKIRFTYLHKISAFQGKKVSYEVELSWDKIFSVISPIMIDEAKERDIKGYLEKYIGKISGIKEREGESYASYKLHIEEEDFDTIKVQFIALGLIEKSEKKRSLKERGVFWKLTPYGENYMIKLRAIKKSR